MGERGEEGGEVKRPNMYMCVNMHMKEVETLVTTSAESCTSILMDARWVMRIP